MDFDNPGATVGMSLLSLVVDQVYFDNYASDAGPKGPATLRSQFAGVTLAPGESFEFVLYTLIPTAGGAARGTYEIVANSLRLSASSQGLIDGGPVRIEVVALPPAIALLLYPFALVCRRIR